MSSMTRNTVVELAIKNSIPVANGIELIAHVMKKISGNDIANGLTGDAIKGLVAREIQNRLETM